MFGLIFLKKFPDPIMYLYFKLSTFEINPFRHILEMREHYFHDPGQNVFVIQPHKDAGESCSITGLT